jgi:23S rRNA (cytosine1962-C5)-methyltransferase
VLHCIMQTARVILRPRKALPFFGRHPWVYPGAIATVEGEPADGDVVDLVSSAGEFVARGIYNGQSKLRVRLYAWDEHQPLDEVFFRERLTAAVRLRRDILKLARPGHACRLVFSEGDGLSGLTVDRYDRWLVMQCTALGIAQRRDLLARLLIDLTGAKGIYLRTEREIGTLEGLHLQDGPLIGSLPDGPITIEENGLHFRVDLSQGQKTGFYLDQRDNRQAVARLAVGRRVLDVFCYTGGFGLHAARAGAAKVLGLDVSDAALALADENARLNGLNNISWRHTDAFSGLRELHEAGERFDMVILDPPKFARTNRAVAEALRGYRRLQSLAARLLEPDGVLVLCCCSGLITLDMLLDLEAKLVMDEKRHVQILECRGQAADHPVSASCRESNYLKCIISRLC